MLGASFSVITNIRTSCSCPHPHHVHLVAALASTLRMRFRRGVPDKSSLRPCLNGDFRAENNAIVRQEFLKPGDRAKALVA